MHMIVGILLVIALEFFGIGLLEDELSDQKISWKKYESGLEKIRYGQIAIMVVATLITITKL